MLWYLRTPPPPPARHEWRRAQKILLQRTTGKSHMGELAPMALCDIHVAGCGEHRPAWGLRDDRMPGTDQAVRGGRHGQKLHSGSPPPPRGRGMPAAVQMPAVVRMPACHSRRFKGERPIGAATGQQSQPPRPCANPHPPPQTSPVSPSGVPVTGAQKGGAGGGKGLERSPPRKPIFPCPRVFNAR